jgi:hypothetical protein
LVSVRDPSVAVVSVQGFRCGGSGFLGRGPAQSSYQFGWEGLGEGTPAPELQNHFLLPSRAAPTFLFSGASTIQSQSTAFSKSALGQAATSSSPPEELRLRFSP